MTTYYVSNAGSDAAAGTSPAAAWETISKVNGETFSAGDSILFNRDDVWRETLVPPSSGSSGSPITFGAYGSGSKPRITGADVVASFTEDTGVTTVASQTSHASKFTNVHRTATVNAYEWAVPWDSTEAFDVAQVRFWLSQVASPTGDVWVEIWDDDSSSPGSIIANGLSDTVDVTTLASDTSGAEQAFAFSTPPSLADATRYWFVLRSNVTVSTVNYLHMWRAASDPGGWDLTWSIFISPSAGEAESTPYPYIGIDKVASTNRWTATVTPDPRVVYFITDDTYGLEQSSAGNVNAANEWHWASNTLTVYATSDPSGDIEVAARDHAANPDGISYLDFLDIQFDTALTYTFRVEGTASNLNLTDVDLLRGFIDNFATAGTSSTSDGTLLRVASSYAGASGFTISSTVAADNWLFQDCTSTHDSYVNGTFARGVAEFGAGFKLVSDRTTDAVSNCVFDGCVVTYAGYLDDLTEVDSTNKGFGFWIDLVVASVGDENIVRNSQALITRQAGLFCEKSEYSIWHHNIASECGEQGLLVGSKFDASGPLTANNSFYNLTLCGNGTERTNTNEGGNWHVSGGFSAVGEQVSDNAFRNIVCVAAAIAKEAGFQWGGENDGTLGENNTYEYLTLGVEASGFVEWGNATNLNTYAAWDTAYQASSGTDIDELHYINADPGLTDPCDDVTPAAGSPVIGAGLFVPGISEFDPATIGAIEVAEGLGRRAIRSPRYGITRVARR